MRTILTFLAALLVWAVLGYPAEAATVKIVVNGDPITDYQINQRMLFMERLEQRGNSNSQRNELAREQLITEALEIQEAARLGIVIADAEVEGAYEQVATNVSVSVGRLTQLLNAAGVNSETLKDRLRAQIAWQQVVNVAVQPGVQLSELDLDIRAAEQAADASYDYILKEILFVIPQGSSISARSRTTDANEYRRLFTGCDSAVQLSLSFSDAAVRDLGRRHSTQLPEALATELAGLNVGGVSTPRTVENGVQLLAVCSKAQARDLSFIKNTLRVEEGNVRLQAAADAYLADLKTKAAIEYR
ncbi:MAG: SurA N-terminal domain-containing protein [Cucumibacter sp.]